MLGALINFHAMESTTVAAELQMVSRDRIIDAWAFLFRRVIDPTGNSRLDATKGASNGHG
jgi:hypothetical protein